MSGPDDDETAVHLRLLDRDPLAFEPDDLRDTLIARFRAYSTRTSQRPDRKHGVPPV